MKTNPRFIKSVIDTASKPAPQMPWARGAKRSEMIVRRIMQEDAERDVRTA